MFLFNPKTKLIEIIDSSKLVPKNMLYMFQESSEKKKQEKTKETNKRMDFELSNPNEQPIFDISFNKMEKKLFVSGKNYLKSFKICDYNF